MQVKNRDIPMIYAAGAILLLITAWLYWDDSRPTWKTYQTGFRALIVERLGAERAKQVPSGIQQVWIAELNRVDRCITCHMGVEWEGMENAPQPYRSHPREILKKHPIGKYGCTMCHGGEGYATSVETAHATFAEHWEEPLLGSEMGKMHQLEQPAALLEINCNVCHRYDQQTEGNTYINYGKQMVAEKRCVACHKINGRGGVIGPDLSFIGDVSAEQLDFTHLSGKATAIDWHVAHFKNPKEISPSSVMPNFNLGLRESQSLAMLMMSWRRVSLPSSYILAPKAAETTAPTPAPTPAPEQPKK